MNEDAKNNLIPVCFKVLIFAFIFVKKGILISIFAIFFLDYSYYIIIKIIFGLTPLTGYDKVFITTKQINRVTILWSLEFSNFNLEKMKTIDKLFCGIPPLPLFDINDILCKYTHFN